MLELRDVQTRISRGLEKFAIIRFDQDLERWVTMFYERDGLYCGDSVSDSFSVAIFVGLSFMEEDD